LAAVLGTPILDHHLPWHVSYQRAGGSGASWAQHGMPALFARFVGAMSGTPAGPHLDIGCGNGVKTGQFARASRRSVGVDIAFDGLRAASRSGIQARLLQGDCVELPFQNAAFATASDILCFTHMPRVKHATYVAELERILMPGGRALVILFSLSDDHFHGHQVSAEYVFRFDPLNPLMTGYEHYSGKVNVHFDRTAIVETFGRTFGIEALTETAHPIYEHRTLWNLIISKPGQ
jgi:ubiquinone/menaquinone biosynthesis C-methylase UbiE